MKKTKNDIFLVENNYILEPLKNDISLSWETKYIGRHVIPEAYEKNISYGEYWIRNEGYYSSGTICYITVALTEDNRIKTITIQKYEDHSPAHGRPITYDKELNNADKAEFSFILDKISIDPIEEEYSNLIQKLNCQSELPSGFCYVSADTSGIKVKSREGKSIVLSEITIKTILLYSHYFVDLLYDEEIMKKARKIIKTKDIPALKSVLSFVDYSSYESLEQLKRDASDRVMLRDAVPGYERLMEAVRRDDFNKVKENIAYAKLFMDQKLPTDNSFFLIAIKHHNYPIAQLLAEHGAYTCERNITQVPRKENDRYFDTTNETPVAAAYDTGDPQLFDLVIQYGGLETFYNNVIEMANAKGDIESLIKIAKTGKEVSHIPDCVTDEQIALLANIKNAEIRWSSQQIKQAYKFNHNLCYNMIDQARKGIQLHTFIDIGDIELYSYCLEKQPNFSMPEDYYINVFDLGGKWHELIKKCLLEGKYTASNYSYYLNWYLKKLIENSRFDEFKEALIRLNIKELDDEFYQVFRWTEDYWPDKTALKSFLEWLGDFERKNNNKNNLEQVMKALQRFCLV